MVTNHINMVPPFSATWKIKTVKITPWFSPSNTSPIYTGNQADSELSATPKRPRFAELHFVLFRVADLWRFNLDRIIVSVIYLMLLFEYPDNLTFYFSCERLSLDRELFFCAKLLRIGETASDRYACGRGLQPWASHFYRASKNGDPGFIRACTLAFFSL